MVIIGCYMVGNVVDPIEMMESYGCDAMRYALAMGTTAGQDISLDIEKIKANRNFVNKLWNAGMLLFGCPLVVGCICEADFTCDAILWHYR
jgi:isoleucyl-tRNA synthetase